MVVSSLDCPGPVGWCRGMLLSVLSIVDFSALIKVSFDGCD